MWWCAKVGSGGGLSLLIQEYQRGVPESIAPGRLGGQFLRLLTE